MQRVTSYVLGAVVATVGFSGTVEASQNFCSKKVVVRMESASAFCACQDFSHEAIEVLNRKKGETWFAKDVKNQCPVRATYVMNALRFVAQSEDATGISRNPARGSSSVTQVTSVSQSVQSEPEPTTTDPVAPAPEQTRGNKRDDNGHGNDPSGVDDSNPGGKY